MHELKSRRIGLNSVRLDQERQVRAAIAWQTGRPHAINNTCYTVAAAREGQLEEALSPASAWLAFNVPGKSCAKPERWLSCFATNSSDGVYVDLAKPA